MKQADIVVPLVLKHTRTVTCVPRWFVQESQYHPEIATFTPLINGEETFAAVHHAIANATKTIDIICWGFQPSMYFIRDGNAPSIGELLKSKAAQGVRVRVLGWEMPANVAGAAGEANLPGKSQHFGRVLLDWDRALQSSTDRQYSEDIDWFKDFEVAGNKAVERIAAGVPLFVSRGFSARERLSIYKEVSKGSLDRQIGLKMIAALMGVPTHHQKSVLVDYELPQQAVGFVMGHNMLDEYWDTPAHSALNRSDYTRPAPNRGPRGYSPRQDISSQVSGPILEHLHHNFAMAWTKETGEELLKARSSIEVGRKLQCHHGTPQMAQLLRTQAQEGLREIEQLYLQAINNATQFIYIENQYFRWPPLAEAIKRAAAMQTAEGRDPGLHGVLHLFVVTNASDDAIGAGTANTQRMLESLGRADTIPEVTRLQRIEQARREIPAPLDPRDRMGTLKLEAQTEAINASVIKPEEIPGLKIHVCSLVAPDSPAGRPWMPVYIHSKLMIIDDVFTTLGSANINTRSMQVDSELNIAHEWPSVTKAMRRRLWDLHTGGKGGQDNPKKAFKDWHQIITDNKERHQGKSGPIAALVEFFYDEATMKDLD
ncbi:phospholipase D-like domain-containing protein [Pseudomonas reidholzensis]|uniref:phospholipase D-like domain-containing protein n=1 Tax=Pseudomonas reidholzensis TaxID=1785162 RepID=UPI0039EF3079